MESEKKPHPISVPGFNGSLKELAEGIAKMRFDKQEEFHNFYEKALVAEAERDEKLRGLSDLPRNLKVISVQVMVTSWLFNILFNRFRKYMEHELEKSEEFL